MHKTRRETELFFSDLKRRLPANLDREVVICPSFPLLSLAVSHAEKRFGIGAQDVFWEKEGAYTGEVSPILLKDLHCQYVIIGHSERRHFFGESNKTVNKKVKASLTEDLRPIVCVGETLEEMDRGKTKSVVEAQVRQGLEGVDVGNGDRLVMAYEPVWAIGTGKADTKEQSNETMGLIRQVIAEIAGKPASEMVRILYGGSVKPENIAGFMSQPEIDGGLVGGASLRADSFAQIVQY